MLWDYRDEGWKAIAHELVKKCLKCAYLTASIQNYVELNLEALKYYKNADLQKALDNIGSIIQVNRNRTLIKFYKFLSYIKTVLDT